MKQGASGFEITVLTGAVDSSLDLTNELRHVKAALLYADRVKLVSPKMAMLEAASKLTTGSDSEFVDRLIYLATPLPQGPEIAAVASAIHRKKGQQRHPAMIAFDARMRAHLTATTRGQFEEIIERFRNQPGVGELYRARDAGVLELDGLDLDAVGLMFDSISAAAGRPQRHRSDEYVSKLMTRVVDVIGPTEATYPLLDAQMIDLVRTVEKTSGAKLDGKSATEPHLAAFFVGEMASFPGAGMDEVLDVRKELDPQLVRFRSAVAGMAREVAETPIDASFERIASALYRERVAPELLAIEEIEKERGLFKQLGRQALSGEAAPDLATTVATASLGLGATNYASLPNLAAAVGGLAGASLSSAYKVAAAVRRERERLADERRKNKFLFLVEADRKLARNG